MLFSNLINATPTSSSILLFDFLDSLKKKTAIDLTTNQTLTKPHQYTKQFFSKREMMALQTNHQKAESREKKVPSLLFPFFASHTKSLSLSPDTHTVEASYPTHENVRGTLSLIIIMASQNPKIVLIHYY